AIVVADGALGLPSCKWPQRQDLGDERRARRVRAERCHLDNHPHPDAVQEILPHVEGPPLLAGFLDDQHRLPGADILADLRDDHVTTPSTGARRMVLSRRRSRTASAAAQPPPPSPRSPAPLWWGRPPPRHGRLPPRRRRPLRWQRR